MSQTTFIENQIGGDGMPIGPLAKGDLFIDPAHGVCFKTPGGLIYRLLVDETGVPYTEQITI